MDVRLHVPAALLRRVDDAAAVLHVSRDELCRFALEHYLGRAFADSVTAKLNEVYADCNSGLDEDVAAAQFRTLEEEDW